MTMPDQLPIVITIEAAARSFSFPATAGVGPMFGPNGVLCGWSLHETTGAATALVQLWDGNGVGGVLLATVELAAGGTDNHTTGPHGLQVRQGVTPVVVSGSAAGSVWLLL